MEILPINKELIKYLEDRQLKNKFEKQKKIFEQNIFYPGLNTELLEPKHMKIWSFRIDKKYRVIFIFYKKDIIEIIDINNHYN